MISLCVCFSDVYNSLLELKTSEYFKHTLLMYLKSYGAEYAFSEFYLQFDENEAVCAVMLRYNSFLYCAASDIADLDEISAWLAGIKDITVYSSVSLSLDNSELCFEMCKRGFFAPSNEVLPLRKATDLKKISGLINQNADESVINEFYLDISHHFRHNNLEIFGLIEGEELVSFAAWSKGEGVSVIPFVYTSEYFRGKGYSKKVLSAMCSDENREYRLICSENRMDFYGKCGFLVEKSCHKYYL